MSLFEPHLHPQGDQSGDRRQVTGGTNSNINQFTSHITGRRQNDMVFYFIFVFSGCNHFVAGGGQMIRPAVFKISLSLDRLQHLMALSLKWFCF
jgi:hypothetical protein